MSDGPRHRPCTRSRARGWENISAACTIQCECLPRLVRVDPVIQSDPSSSDWAFRMSSRLWDLRAMFCSPAPGSLSLICMVRPSTRQLSTLLEPSHTPSGVLPIVGSMEGLRIRSVTGDLTLLLGRGSGEKSNFGYDEKAILFGRTSGRLALDSGDRQTTCAELELLVSVRGAPSALESLIVPACAPEHGGQSARGWPRSLSGLLVPPDDSLLLLLLPDEWRERDCSSLAKHGVKLSLSSEVVGNCGKFKCGGAECGDGTECGDSAAVSSMGLGAELKLRRARAVVGDWATAGVSLWGVNCKLKLFLMPGLGLISFLMAPPRELVAPPTELRLSLPPVE